jgi:hypothetical protein
VLCSFGTAWHPDVHSSAIILKALALLSPIRVIMKDPSTALGGSEVVKEVLRNATNLYLMTWIPQVSPVSIMVHRIF